MSTVLKSALVIGALASSTLVTSGAMAQGGKAPSRPPLTIHGRTFLDPGPVVPVGQEHNYIAQSTYLNQTDDQVSSRARYGNEALPRRFEVPGRSTSLFNF